MLTSWAHSLQTGTAPIDPLPPSRPSASQIQATTAASLLSTDALPRFSTCIDALDDLLAHFVPSSAPPPLFTQNGEPSGTQDPKGKRRAGNITPGMSVEIAGPPGIGKSCVALAMAVDARFMACRKRRRRSSQGGEVRGEGGEALIIGEYLGVPSIPMGRRSRLTRRHRGRNATRSNIQPRRERDTRIKR